MLASHLFLLAEDLPQRTKDSYPKIDVWSQWGSSEHELWFRATYDMEVCCSRALSLQPCVVAAASLSLLPPCDVVRVRLRAPPCELSGSRE